MITDDFEADVAAMLRRRAADVAHVMPPPPVSDIAFVSDDDIDHPPPIELPAPWSAVERWRWQLVAAAVLAAGMVAALLLWPGDDDARRVDVGNRPIEPPAEGAAPPPTGGTASTVPLDEASQLQVRVVADGPAAGLASAVLLLEVVDAEGRPVDDVSVASRPVVDDMDPATPGWSRWFAGSPPLSGGDYEVRLWTQPCPAAGCYVAPVAPLPVEDRSGQCTYAVTLERDHSLNLTAGPPPECAEPKIESSRNDGPDMDARKEEAWQRLEQERAAGWGRAGMDAAFDWYPFGAGWMRHVAVGIPVGCALPTPVDQHYPVSCIFDRPDGDVVGVHFQNGLGFVPIEALGTLDIDQAYLDRTGCLSGDSACQMGRERQRMEREVTALRRTLEDATLDPGRRAELERDLQQMEQLLATWPSDG